ncbi:MAG: putative metal-dependent hydrolase [Cyclobacteriaceae bacterium]|nr:putative metal-dependent hydrolase [Cyclobacteriaceae bacterium]
MLSEEQLKYPIGRFLAPDTISEALIRQWVDVLESFPFRVFQVAGDLSPAQLDWAYRPGGWTIRQVVHHCADSHMNSFVRFKWALTESKPVIKAYEEAKWARLADSYTAPIEPSLSLLDALHQRWVYLLRSLSENDRKRTYVHPETNREISLATTIGMYAWHCEHHYTHILQALEFEGRYTGQPRQKHPTEPQ